MRTHSSQPNPQGTGDALEIRSRLPLTQLGGILLFLFMAFTLTSCIGGGGAPTPASSVASLSALEVKSGTQSFAVTPAYDPARLDYVVTVGSNVSAITITATVADTKATLKINNQVAISGQPFGPVNLVLGANAPITILVDGPGFSQTYSVTITRAVTTHLSSLVASAGTLIQVGTNQPGFTQSETDYTLQAPFTTTTTTVIPTVADSAASVTVNGAAVSSGQPSQAISLGVGQTVITVVVTAPSVPSTTYTITVTRQQGSTNANLSAMTVSPGTLAPTFSPATLTYAASVNNVTQSVTVTAIVQVTTSTLQINNQPATSGAPFVVSNLAEGPNPITVTVIPQSGSPQVYVVTVNRAAPGNANLAGLTVTPGTLAPVFSAGTFAYTVNVLNTVTSATVTPTVADLTSTMTINGQAASSGVPLTINNLPVGNTLITIAVTANPAGNSKTYTVTIVKAAPGNANLADLTVTPGTLTPTFTSGTLAYTVNVLNPVANVSVTATAAVGTSTLTINGQGIASGTALVVPLGAAGTVTPISIVVTAAQGNQQTYTLSVSRASAGNADLAGLTVTPGSLAPAFSAATLAYTVNVLNPVANVSVTATAAVGTSTLTINGQGIASGTALVVPLGAAGTVTPISIVVTALEGNSQTYTVIVNRPLPGDATLSALTVVPGTTTPSFSPATVLYTVGVSNTDTTVTVTASMAAGTSTMTINGQAVGNATPFIVNLGVPGTSTPISIVVTALEGNSQPYTVTVNKPL